MSTAVLVVDAVQTTFDHLGSDGEHALDVAGDLVATARDAGIHVVHTRLEFRLDGLDGGQYFRRNPELAALAETPPQHCPTVAPTDAEVVVGRSYPSAFFGTSLAATLRGAGVRTVVIVGAATSGSVRASALDALQHGFVPVVVVDATADPSPPSREASLNDLAAHYADVLASGQVTSLLTRRTSAD